MTRSLILQSRTGKYNSIRPEEIASHPVGAGQVEVVFSAVEEVENARVLEKPSYDRAHAHVLQQPRNSGTPGSRNIHSRNHAATRFAWFLPFTVSLRSPSRPPRSASA